MTTRQGAPESALLGDQTDAHIARGAAMSYNELTDYALSALESA